VEELRALVFRHAEQIAEGLHRYDVRDLVMKSNVPLSTAASTTSPVTTLNFPSRCGRRWDGTRGDHRVMLVAARRRR
jgi:hypothetical protein